MGTLALTAPWEPPDAFPGRFGRSKVSCDTIWKTRKRLISTFWNNIAPDSWKPHQKVIKNVKKLHEIKIAEQCLNPFHFLIKNKDLSKQKPTICRCSYVQESGQLFNFRDISSFFISNKPSTHCQQQNVISLPVEQKRPLAKNRIWFSDREKQDSNLYKFRDISTFFISTSTNCQHNDCISLKSKQKRPLYITREDRIRGAHDRDKRLR